jgi:glycosyltransferase involved in cell wall biosynthesis
MRAAFLVPSLGLGGAERAVVKLANGLVNLGWSVHLIVFGPIDTDMRGELINSVGVSTTRTFSAASPWLWLIVGRRLRAFSPDIVIGWSTNANLVAALVSAVVRKWRVIVVERNYPPSLYRRLWTPTLRRSLTLRAMRSLYRRADVVGANSDMTLTFMRRYLGEGPAYIKFSNSIAVRDVDDAAIQPVSDLPPEWVGPRLLAVGRLCHQKGFDVLLRALALVRRQHPWRLAIIGDGEEREPLKALAENLKVAEGLIWLGSRANPFPYYRWADIVISSSRYEGSPNVLLEAMAVGKATISTDCRTGPRELTDGGQAGVLVPVDDAAGLASAILRVGADDALRGHLARRARQRVIQCYETEAVVSQIASSLQSYAITTCDAPSRPAKGDK